MLKVTNKMTKEFLKVAEEAGEFIFGDLEQVRKQLEICLNRQGYWSGCSVRIFYDEDEKEFYVESRF